MGLVQLPRPQIGHGQLLHYSEGDQVVSHETDLLFCFTEQGDQQGAFPSQGPEKNSLKGKGDHLPAHLFSAGQLLHLLDEGRKAFLVPLPDQFSRDDPAM
jgi:hypothetical protein